MITKTITKAFTIRLAVIVFVIVFVKNVFEIICVNSLTTKKTLALAFYPDGKANANAKVKAN